MTGFSTLRHCLASLSLALLVAAPARAQTTADSAAPARVTVDTDALWYSLSVGAGSARFTCDPCATGRDTGPAARVAVGAYARPGLRVGVTGGYWTHEQGELRESARQAGLVANLDVRPGSRIHLIAGLGWIGWRAEPFAYDAVDVSVGAGFSVPLAGRWALSNSATVHSASFGKLRNGDGGDGAVRDVSLSLAGFEVGLTRR
jgi:hypothetical protein